LPAADTSRRTISVSPSNSTSPVGEQRPDALRRRGRQPELALDDRGRRTLAHATGVRAAADEQIDRLDEQRLARAGLARDRDEPRSQLELGVLDDGEVPDRQALEHA
jgi:hypothetical protein